MKPCKQLFAGWKFGVLLLLVASAGLWACQEEEAEDIPTVPSILQLEVTPLQITAYQDSLSFRLQYKDPNGDLGTANPDEFNLFIRDNRLDVVHEFRIPQLAPDNANPAITGWVNAHLQSVILADESSAEETTTFTLWVVDALGNRSNEVESPQVTIMAAP